MEKKENIKQDNSEIGQDCNTSHYISQLLGIDIDEDYEGDDPNLSKPISALRESDRTERLFRAMLADRLVFTEYIRRLIADFQGDVPVIEFREDHPKFINGVKQPTKPTELKSASRPPMVSEVDFSKIYKTNNAFVKLAIPGMKGNYYVRTNTVKKWLGHFIERGKIRVANIGGDYSLIVEVRTSRKTLLKHCIKR